MPATAHHIEHLYRQHARRVLATLIRLLGDFTLAEEALQEAFVAALQQWPEQGIPDNPAAWLIRTGQRRGIDHMRRHQTARHYTHLVSLENEPLYEPSDDSIGDDQLRLLFTCCHPALGADSRVALTLREMCGLTTEQVARALLLQPATVAQRIVRAKRKIRDAGIPYQVPEADELPDRLPGVLQVIYLVFNEGYSRSEGESVVDVSLSGEAVRLTEELAMMLPDGEVFGLLALMLLQHARRHARQDGSGELVTLEEQDRSLWDADNICAGLSWLERALAQTPVAPYTLQASIAAEHARATRSDDTDWRRIALLYEALYRQQPSPVIALNRAVAVAMRDTPAAGLVLLEELRQTKAIQGYYLFHAAEADLLRRAGDIDAARQAYQRALQLTSQVPERRFLERRLQEVARGCKS